jgi:DNA adenine methylase
MKLLFLRNDLVGSDYAELYAGGGAVALSLLYEEYASHIYINDLDPSVFAFWQGALESTEELCKRILDTAVSVEEWHFQRAVQEADSPDPLDLAFSTFFLNRTNRSGIIRGGVIGGQSQSGNWSIDARYNKASLIRRIQKIARFRSRITLTCIDAAEYLRTKLPTLNSRLLAYLDPPYVKKGSDLYRNSYELADHAEVARLVPLIKQSWIVSYDAADEILALYAEHSPLRYSLSYSAHERYQGSELMYLSPDLSWPNVPSPANIPTSVVEATQRALYSAPP